MNVSSDLAAATPLLSMRRLRVTVPRRRMLPSAAPKRVDVIAWMDLDLPEQCCLGVIGESGCGKTTLARALAGLQACSAGSIRLAGEECSTYGEDERQALRRRLWLIDARVPDGVRPRSKVFNLLDALLKKLEPKGDAAARRQRIVALLQEVELDAAIADVAWKSLTPGQARRVAIARALAGRVPLLICDEPTVDLEPHDAFAIVDLLQRLARQPGRALLLLTSRPRLAARISDRLMSIYLGRVMEQGACEAVVAAPAHPYTRALLEAAPSVERGFPQLRVPGERADPALPPIGCVFHPRCPMAEAACVREPPHLHRTGVTPRHYAACLFAPEAPPESRPRNGA